MSCSIRKIANGTLFDAHATMYPSALAGRTAGEGEFQNPSSTYYGFVCSGALKIFRHGLPAIELAPGMYFSVPGTFGYAATGEFIAIERMGYRGLFTAGGPVEDTGRLCYIDNCSVTQLIPPARLGDPTLQQLVFPPDVDQTMHIHPTIRMGFVYAGQGFCKSADGKKQPLEKGDVFYIPERHTHGFQSAGSPMGIIAYHPDTDVGPTDQCHPMLSRTFIAK